MKIRYCKHCRQIVDADDMVEGYGFIYHLRCFAAIYGWFED